MKSTDFMAQLHWIKHTLFSKHKLFEKREHVLVSPKKSAEGTLYNPLQLSNSFDRTLTILIPVGKDQCNLHVVCLVDNLIFDSSLNHPMKLAKESLDWCCNCEGGMSSVNYAVRFKVLSTVLEGEKSQNRYSAE